MNVLIRYYPLILVLLLFIGGWELVVWVPFVFQHPEQAIWTDWLVIVGAVIGILLILLQFLKLFRSR